MKLSKKTLHRLGSAGGIAAALTISTGVQAGANADFQTWIPININLKLGEQLRGFLEFQPRIGDDSSHLTSIMIRPALGWAVTPAILILEVL